MLYKNTQIGYVLIVANMIVISLLGYVFTSVETDAIGKWGLAIFLLLFLFLLFLFFSLTVKVTDTEVTWYFGPGLWKYNIQLDQIKDVEVVKTNPLEGIGIRFTPSKGLLYNVSGLSAVKIIKKDGDTIRIGSNEPIILAEVISKNTDISDNIFKKDIAKGT